MRRVTPEILTHNHALRLRARQDLTDVNGVVHYTGEEWLVREVGAYLTGVFEEVKELINMKPIFLSLFFFPSVLPYRVSGFL